MADYFPLLSRTVASLDCKSAEDRHVVYERARRALNEHLEQVRPPLSELTIRTEHALLEAAIRRVERNAVRLQPPQQPPVARAPAPRVEPQREPPRPDPAQESQREPPRPGPARPQRDPPRATPAAAPPASMSGEEATALDMADPVTSDAEGVEAFLQTEKRRLSSPVLAAIAVAGVAVIAIGAFAMWPRSSGQTSRLAAGLNTGTASRAPDAAKPDPEGGLPYVYRRQPVYYRTTNPVGTVIVDKSQRLLYLVQPNVSALRYGIGVGRGCLDIAGLLRVTGKEEPTSAPAKALGARVIYLGNETQVIHGTDSSKNIGGDVPKGCFLLVNDAVVDLYDRIKVGAGVVVTD
jgi:lipoprotein-anchoring transpeptidase ErfK/SrfK